MRSLKQRVAMTLIATLVAGLLGAIAGWMIGGFIALHLTESRLSLDASRAISDSVAYSTDAHQTLDAMNASHQALCSPADLETLHRLLYNSRYLKDIGRVRDNRIACTAELGVIAQPELPNPVVVGADGVKVYRDLPLFQLDRVTVTSLQEGDSFVVLNPFINTLRGHTAMHLTTSVIQSSQNHPEQAPIQAGSVSELILTQDANFRVGRMLYSTRCSYRFNTCMTASFSLDEALDANRMQFQGYILFGAMGGGFLGFIVSLAYRRNRGMERQLHRAIRQDKLKMVYQPVIDLDGGRIVGAEALARWTDDEGLTVSPDVFVKIAEDCGFVSELTRLVIRHVLRDFAKQMRANPDFRVNVNVTAADLADPAFPAIIAEMLHRAGVRAQSLGIEITESCSARKGTVIEAIRLLRERGHCVYIDDFGTGYSSLSYLNELGVDAIKIDKAFTKAIGTEAVTVGILPQILSMAQVLNLKVVAEGIETSEQADFFSAAAMPVQAQGWYFGFPFPVAEFHTMLAENEVNSVPAEVE